MRQIEKYYENTKNFKQHKNVSKFITLGIKPTNAIELGCGAGRDTVYLIKNGWNVLAIDREDVNSLIIEKLNDEELKKFRFLKQKFEDVILEKNNLIVANYSIPFCNKNIFEEFWKRMTDSILPGGYFVGNFFGINDEWKNIRDDMVFLEKEQVKKLFENFEIIDFKEIEENSKTGMGDMKHWHIFNVIAKKSNKLLKEEMFFMKEKRDLYNEKGELTGLTYYKGDKIPDGYYPMVVMIAIQNSNGEFLMQKRVPEKGGDWGVTGGHPKSGENCIQGIIAEVREELGIDISNEKIIEFRSGCDGVDCYKMYYTKLDLDIDKLDIQKEELTEVRWFSMDQLENMVKTQELNENQIAFFKKCTEFLNKNK